MADWAIIPETPPVRAGLGISTRPEGHRGVEDALEAALEDLEGAPPDAVIAVATAALGQNLLGELMERLALALDCPAWLAASAEGLLLADREIVGLPGFALVALSGVPAEVFACEGLAGRESAAADEMASQLSGQPGPDDLLVVFADSHRMAPAPVLEALAEVAGPAAVVGFGASEVPGGSPQVWAAGDRVEDGCAGLWLRPSRPPEIAVSDGLRPVAEEMEVTRAQGHWVLGLDGYPALECLRDVSGVHGSGGEVREILARLSQAGVAGEVVRNLVGVDPVRRAFALATPVAQGDRIRLVRRDSRVARENLRADLAELSPCRPGLGLYFSCPSRGARLFEHEGLESGYLAGALGPAPLLGMMGAFQLAPDPRGTVPLLHTYSGVLARFEGS